MSEIIIPSPKAFGASVVFVGVVSEAGGVVLPVCVVTVPGEVLGVVSAGCFVPSLGYIETTASPSPKEENSSLLPVWVVGVGVVTVGAVVTFSIVRWITLFIVWGTLFGICCIIETVIMPVAIETTNVISRVRSISCVLFNSLISIGLLYHAGQGYLKALYLERICSSDFKK